MYRLYDKDNVYLRSIEAKTYDEAKDKLNPSTTDKIFCVDEDNHEIECGLAWVKDLLDNASKPLIHIKDCELGDNWKDCPACLNHRKDWE